MKKYAFTQAHLPVKFKLQTIFSVLCFMQIVVIFLQLLPHPGYFCVGALRKLINFLQLVLLLFKLICESLSIL